MGIVDYISDLYAAMAVQHVYAEAPQKDEGDGSDGGEAKQAESSDGGEGEESAEGGGGEGGEEGGDDRAEEGGGDDEAAEEEEDEQEEEEEDDDDEPVDIKPKLEEECLKSAQCAPLKHHYDECAERVKHQEEQYGKPSEDCVEEFFHMMHCATQCAAPKLFKELR